MQDIDLLLTGLPTTPETLIFKSNGQYFYNSVCCPTKEHRGIVVTTSEVPTGCGGEASVSINDQYVPPFQSSPNQPMNEADFLAEEAVGTHSGALEFEVRNTEIYKGRLGNRGKRYRFSHSDNVDVPLQNYSFQLHRLEIPLDGSGNASEVFVADDSQEIVEGQDYHTLQVNAASVRRGVRREPAPPGQPVLPSALFRLQAVFNSVYREFFIILKERTR